MYVLNIIKRYVIIWEILVGRARKFFRKLWKFEKSRESWPDPSRKIKEVKA